jgi:hypothetical protein
MREKLLEYITECDLYEKQRIFWLRISGFIAVVILLIIAEWKMINNTTLEWFLVSAGLTIMLIWWYWSMMIIRRLLLHKKITLKLILDLSDDFDEMAKKIRENH